MMTMKGMMRVTEDPWIDYQGGPLTTADPLFYNAGSDD